MPRCAVEFPGRFLQVGAVKRFFLLTLSLGLVLAGCKDSATVAAPPAPATNVPLPGPAGMMMFLPHAQTNLMRMKVFVGTNELDTALALKPLERQTGMMWRTNMGEGEAMLFPFPIPHRAAFYMKNTYVPLSLAYIDSEGVIQEIHDLQPLNENSVEAGVDTVQHVLEVKQGWFKRHNVSTGMVVSTQFGELKKTFNFNN